MNLLRFCLIDGGYLLALTLERLDESGIWVHVRTLPTTSSCVGHDFEALVQAYDLQQHVPSERLPFFSIVNGVPRAVQGEDGQQPFELREAINGLLEHYFVDEAKHHDSLPREQRDGHVFGQWLAVLNWLEGSHGSPAAAATEPPPATRVPAWLTVLSIMLLLPALLHLPLKLLPNP